MSLAGATPEATSGGYGTAGAVLGGLGEGSLRRLAGDGPFYVRAG